MKTRTVYSFTFLVIMSISIISVASLTTVLEKDNQHNDDFRTYYLHESSNRIYSAEDNYEPDNSIEDAKIIENGIWQNHSISPIGDIDFVKFTLETRMLVNVFTNSTVVGDCDTYLKLINGQTGSTIESNNDNGDSTYSKIEIELDAGNYYLSINEYGDDKEIPEYNLFMILSEPSPYILVLNPLIHAYYFPGETFDIKWATTEKINSVLIELYTEEDVNIGKIGEALGSVGIFAWTISDDLSPGTHYIRISAVNLDIFNESALFRILEVTDEGLFSLDRPLSWPNIMSQIVVLTICIHFTRRNRK